MLADSCCFLLVLTRPPCAQIITLVDAALGLVALAVVETQKTDKKAGEKTALYLHAFAVRADLRSQPGLKLGTFLCKSKRRI